MLAHDLARLAGIAGGTPPAFDINAYSRFLTRTGTSSVVTLTGLPNFTSLGGLALFKRMTGGTYNWRLVDTVRGAQKHLTTNANSLEASEPDGLQAFTSDGFTLGTDSSYNSSAGEYFVMLLMMRARLLDIRLWTGNGQVRTIPHSLGVPPGMVIIKKRGTVTAPWPVYHRSLGNTKVFFLQSTTAPTTSSSYWNNTDPTATELTLSTHTNLNGNAETYVGYFFAHDPEPSGAIWCDSFTTDPVGDANVNWLPWEPQFLLMRPEIGGAGWSTSAIPLGIEPGVNERLVYMDSTAAEVAGSDVFRSHSKGINFSGLLANTKYDFCMVRRP